jgi:hypothetical protein
MTGEKSPHGSAMGPRSALPSAITAVSARVIVRAKANNAARVGRIDEWH